MRWILGLLLVVGVAVFALSRLPAPIDPVSWTPDPNPGLTGPFAPNDKLAGAERVLEGAGVGPEDIACDADSTFFTGLEDGRILWAALDGSFRELANTGGRPLGMELDKVMRRLIVADADRGLLAITPTGDVEVLTDTVNGEKIKFADDVAVAADGTIWFSDASTTHGYKDNLLNFLEGKPTGRLLSYDPASRETRVRMDGLFFANGVAMGPGDAYVLVTETGAGRIHRLWLQGEQAGQRDLFAANLPGTPDNISFNGSDTFWVAMPSLRAALDSQARWPAVRKLLSHLPPDVLAAGVSPYAFVVALGLDGKVKDNRQSTGEGYTMITSANECNGSLYLGSVTQSALGRVPL
jgi:sugar lactone lactonase YvrE